MITSIQNEKIKNILRLKKARERKKRDLIIIEGKKEIELAIEAGLVIQELYLSPELGAEFDFGLKNIFDVDKKVFAYMAYREHPDGYLALAVPKYLSFKDVELKKNPLVLILEKVEKPGNLGAILRTADAAGVEAVIVNDAQTDIFNPNVIRASLGTVFLCPVINLSKEETVVLLKKHKVKIYAAALPAKNSYLEADFRKGTAIVLGAEHEGLSGFWLDNADELIKIPMRGKIDSLNVSVSAAIMVFEAIRQRNKVKGQ